MMKKIFLALIIATIYLTGFSQQNFLNFKSDNSRTKKTNKNPYRIIDDQGIKGIEVEYQFDGANVLTRQHKNTHYQSLFINNFSMLEEVGKPALPAHTDIIAIPENATATVKIISIEYKVYNNYLIYPALKLAVDKVGAPNPEFEIDNEFYNQDVSYPSKIIDITEIQKVRGLPLASVKICPVQYNPLKKTITVYSKIRYKIEFSNTSSSFFNTRNNSEHFLNIIPNYMLNNKAIKEEIKKQSILKTSVSKGEAKDYIIIVQSDYIAAADSLAKWKTQMGYKVEIVAKQFWSSAEVKSEVASRYNLWIPKPDFVVFLGDHQSVPGQIIVNSMGDSFASDLYYTCMDGASDYYPDMARGRITVNSPAQALMVVQKIIKYERNPVNNALFYKNGLNAAYFQDDDNNGYADRRFALTSEDIRNYMVNQQNYNVTRVYKTGTSVNPMYWNNGTYANGEAVPAYLKKPTFPWAGNYTDINNAINSTNGMAYVFHRDHGYELGWGDPSYTNTNVANLTNATNMPIVFSINCLTGKYLETECFSEKFLRQPNGGTAGIFGHAEVSYSGYNDGLSLGLVDAIWANPGLIPNFTGNGDNPQGTPTAHAPIYTLGDVGNQGLIRMVQTWGNNQYTFELLHYFGDPSMKIWTNNPTLITANHNNTINCTTDTSLVITNSSCLNAIATLMVGKTLIGSTQLINGTGTIYFSQIYGTQAELTLTAHNYRPYIANITINGDCPNARFTINPGKNCIMDSVFITNQSSGNISSYFWDFGTDASPATSTLAQPGAINYSTSGNKTISLTVTDTSNNNYYFIQNLVIEPFCKYYMPITSIDSSNACSGILYDDGGLGEYSNNVNGLFKIKVPGAANISLNFTSFNFNASDDIIIYDGENTLSPSLGTFSGNNLPNGGMISSTSNVITIQQITNSTLTKPGFELTWHCNLPAPPIANFKYSDTISCKGEIKFNDFSLNLPSNWLWNFGDGNTSNIQHPTHIYQTNGTFSVKLIISNSYGADTIEKQDIITINRPISPTYSGNTANCGPSSFNINVIGQGIINWFNSPTSTIPFDTGYNYTTAILNSNQSVYFEAQTFGSSKYGGKSDNSGGGSYFNNTNIHYLSFDCTTPSFLKSVKVYAASAGNRTINLRSSSGNIIASKTIMIPQGESRINLGFSIPAENNLQLEGSASPNLYRNNAGCNYPYLIGNTIKITKSSATQSPTAYYYFFYDWEIQNEMCFSSRQKLELFINTNKPIPLFSTAFNNLEVSFSNQTIDGNSFFWDFGDGTTSNSVNPLHQFANYGNYNVKLISYNACGTDSITMPVSIALGLNEDILDKSVTIIPNPTNGIFNIKMTTNENVDRIQIFNTSGQLVYNENIIKEKSNFSINIADFAKGIYYIHIQNKTKIITKKIVKI